MTEDELDRVAAELDVQLPTFYREFILQHASEFARISEALPARATLSYTPTNLLYHNRQVRTDPMAFRNGPWPMEYFVVGVHGCEDYWYVKLDGSDQAVWAYWCETGETERAYESLDDWLRELQSDLQRPDEWQWPPGGK
jgi:hypothetical protein